MDAGIHPEDLALPRAPFAPDHSPEAWRRSMLIGVVAVFFLLLGSLAHASADTSSGREHLKNGKAQLDAGRYEDAVGELTTAEKEFPLLGDYALLFLSEAYHKLGDHDRSYEVLRELFDKYPSSPLVRKARTAEIREAKEKSKDGLLQLYESYLKDYPDDNDVKMGYGLALKASGSKAKAIYVFREIYVGAGPLSAKARAELGDEDIRPADLLERATNLLNKFEFKEAERVFRKALAVDDGENRKDILKGLAYALFRQKDYKAAASLYEKAGDTYYRARSLYRAGDRDGLDAALRELRESKDARAGELLLAVASDKRREADFDGAVRAYREVIEKYPSQEEDALWGIGWTYYLSSDYGKAAGILSKLYSRHGDPKYLYWQARSVEAAGKEAGELYVSLGRQANNFYCALSQARNGTAPPKPVSVNETVQAAPGDGRRIERVEALLSIGMAGEGVFELSFLSKDVDNPQLMLYVVSKLQALGEFRRSLSLVTKMPYSPRVHGLWYPRPFWDEVEKSSKKNDIDPFIVLSVIREESRFDSAARSAAGAIGLMQLMPHTAYHLDKSLGLGISRDSQLKEAGNNISLGAFYLKSLFGEFKSLPLVLASYNAGEAAVRKWEKQGHYRSVDEFIEDIPYPETRNYVKKVINSYFQYRNAADNPKEINLNVILGNM